MNVIGHDDKCVNFNSGIMCWYFMPYIVHHLSGRIRVYLAFGDLSKKMDVILRAYVYKIRARLSVVIML